MLNGLILLFASFLTSCMEKSDEALPQEKMQIRYLALGDSYTIGQSVPYDQNFPNQLKRVLTEARYSVPDVKIIARTGWRTDNLKNAIESEVLADDYDLVTLLIGVNNQYQGRTVESYKPEFLDLLLTAIKLADGNKQHVVVLSIPDYGATPFGNNNATQIGLEIDAYNAVNKHITDSLGVTYLDITPISREAVSNAALVASDGLHPSTLMYQRWVELLAPIVVQKFPK